MNRRVHWIVVGALLAGLLAACSSVEDATLSATKGPKAQVGINVLLDGDATLDVIAQLERYGRVNDVIAQIDAVTMRARLGDLDRIRALPFVLAANPDSERNAPPIDTVAAENFSDGLSTWNLDVVNVTDAGLNNRQVAYDGAGVYVAVLDTGLLGTWRQYFPEERIAEEYAKSFGGGGGERGSVSDQPNKWENDVNSHGTHVTSTILGFNVDGLPINGVAPLATVIPVKVLNQNGSGWSSVVARGIAYIGELKAGPLAEHPVVINMSLGGPALDALEKAAIDYALEQGVIIVASAGNAGEDGMGYPGAYAPVISVAASGWKGEWLAGNTWWYASDVPDPTVVGDYYITDFSSREHAGQQLDVAAPGSWVVGPYQLQRGKTSYFFLGGTSMASPHVAGIAALMAQKNNSLTAAQVEATLKASALEIAPGCQDIFDPNVGATEVCWGADATGSGLATADAALAATATP